jgi:hypothetical protein
MKKVIHVNQHIIRNNKKTGSKTPPITVKTYKDNHYSDKVSILDRDGNVVATVLYSPEKPLSCGAHVWIETDSEVRID